MIDVPGPSNCPRPDAFPTFGYDNTLARNHYTPVARSLGLIQQHRAVRTVWRVCVCVRVFVIPFARFAHVGIIPTRHTIALYELAQFCTRPMQGRKQSVYVADPFLRLGVPTREAKHQQQMHRSRCSGWELSHFMTFSSTTVVSYFLTSYSLTGEMKSSSPLAHALRLSDNNNGQCAWLCSTGCLQ